MQSLGKPSERLVTCAVSAEGVDAFKVIEIDERYSEPRIGGGVGLINNLELVLQGASGEKPGERVAFPAVGHFLIGAEELLAVALIRPHQEFDREIDHDAQ